MVYEKENERWKDELVHTVTNDVAKLMVMKLARHFKLPIRYV